MEQFLFPLRGQGAKGITFEEQQRPVAAIDLQPDSEFVDQREGTKSGNQHQESRHEDHEDPVEQAREPEGLDAAVQEALARFVVAEGVFADRELMFERGRELPALLEETRLSMDLARGLEKEIGQRGMQPLSGDEFHGETDEHDILGRQVLAQIDRSLGQLDLLQKGVAAQVGVSLRERVQLNVGRSNETPQGLHGR